MDAKAGDLRQRVGRGRSNSVSAVPRRAAHRGLGASATLTVKRIVDASVAFVSMLFLAPLFGAIALALLAERRGPVFYTQERLGLGGRPFRIIKFRSMIADA